MATVIITAQVEDPAKWEQAFETHDDIFRTSYGAASVRFAAAQGNEVATFWEVSDADAFLQNLGSQETIDAMAADGVKRETVKTFVVDRTVHL